MNCYCQGHQVITLGICCPKHTCNENKRNVNNQQTQKQKIIGDIEKNFASLLEAQLKNLSIRKQQQIDQLMQTISKLKSQNLRLENRNKLDKDSESRLKQQIRNQSKRIKQLQDLLDRPVRIQKKQIFIEKTQNNQTLNPQPNEISNLEFEQLRNQLVKLRSRNYQIQTIHKDLIQRQQRQRAQNDKILQNLKAKIASLQSALQQKNKQITQLQNQKIYLTQKIDILGKPSKVQFDPIIVHKITNQAPEIRTVYVDKPVQKTKIVQIEKVIKQFIQPQRPIVNRIIQCGPTKNCRCQDDSPKNSQKRTYEEYFGQNNSQIKNEYNQVISQYKGERQKLLKAIENRDSDYRLLQKKIGLIQKFGQNSDRKQCHHPSVVDVKVFKNQQINSSEPSQKQLKNNTNANKATGINRNTKKK